MAEKEISQAVIGEASQIFPLSGRIKRRRCGTDFLTGAVRHHECDGISDPTGFNNFGGFGQQGYGYNVEYLYQEIGRILGLDKTHHLIIVGGMANLGTGACQLYEF